jgi:LysM repeat protein
MAAEARLSLSYITKRKMDRKFHRLTRKMARGCQVEKPSKVIARFLAALWIVFVVITSLPVGGAEAGAAAQKKGGGSPYAVLDAVNAIRSANGLAPFQVNGALMAAAQAHSEYQASIGSTTHSGRGGSNPGSRAVAAGYGGGSVIENIYGGMGATPQQAVSWWQGDGTHLATILSTRHTDAGAGVAVSDAGVVYYTLDVGSASGSSSAGNGSASAPATGGSGTSNSASATSVAYTPLLVSTPNADGAVIHVVEPGQTLWAISAAYDINILDLLAINGLNANSFIVPGQKIVIRQAGSMPTATEVVVDTTEEPTRTPRPSATPTQPVTEQANLSPTLSASRMSSSDLGASSAEKVQALDRVAPRSGIDPLLVVIVSLMVGGLLLVVAGNVLKRAG